LFDAAGVELREGGADAGLEVDMTIKILVVNRCAHWAVTVEVGKSYDSKIQLDQIWY